MSSKADHQRSSHTHQTSATGFPSSSLNRPNPAPFPYSGTYPEAQSVIFPDSPKAAVRVSSSNARYTLTLSLFSIGLRPVDPSIVNPSIHSSIRTFIPASHKSQTPLSSTTPPPTPSRLPTPLLHRPLPHPHLHRPLDPHYTPPFPPPTIHLPSPPIPFPPPLHHHRFSPPPPQPVPSLPSTTLHPVAHTTSSPSPARC